MALARIVRVPYLGSCWRRHVEEISVLRTASRFQKSCLVRLLLAWESVPPGLGKEKGPKLKIGKVWCNVQRTFGTSSRSGL